MILRLTVEDNDYTEEIEKFATNDLFYKLLLGDISREDMSPTETRNAIAQYEEMNRILNPNITEELTDEDKVLLRAAVFMEWCKFVDTLPKDERIKEYLKNDFKVDASFEFIDQWENGEVVYYFTKSQQWVTQ